jgi:hypothetical protein
MVLLQARLENSRRRARRGLDAEVQRSTVLEICASIDPGVDGSGFAKAVTSNAGGVMSLPNSDDWTIDSWRREPRLHGLQIDDPPESDAVPGFWKDLTLASIVAVVLWITAAVVFG